MVYILGSKKPPQKAKSFLLCTVQQGRAVLRMQLGVSKGEPQTLTLSGPASLVSPWIVCSCSWGRHPSLGEVASQPDGLLNCGVLAVTTMLSPLGTGPAWFTLSSYGGRRVKLVLSSHLLPRALAEHSSRPSFIPTPLPRGLALTSMFLCRSEGPSPPSPPVGSLPGKEPLLDTVQVSDGTFQVSTDLTVLQTLHSDEMKEGLHCFTYSSTLAF